jgi:hypothetical protein
MPTILRVDGFDVRINTADHEPAHVHVYKAGGMAKIYLEPVFVKSRMGMSARMAAQAELIVADHRGMLLKAWREIHG